MKVYVAGKFEEKNRVSALMLTLKELGHTITHDWTTATEEGQTPSTLCDYLEKQSILDYNGILNCDVVIVLAHPEGKGLYVEMGIALSAYKPVIYVDRPDTNCIFDCYSSVIPVNTIEQAITVLGWIGRY